MRAILHRLPLTRETHTTLTSDARTQAHVLASCVPEDVLGDITLPNDKHASYSAVARMAFEAGQQDVLKNPNYTVLLGVKESILNL